MTSTYLATERWDRFITLPDDAHPKEHTLTAYGRDAFTASPGPNPSAAALAEFVVLHSQDCSLVASSLFKDRVFALGSWPPLALVEPPDNTDRLTDPFPPYQPRPQALQ